MTINTYKKSASLIGSWKYRSDRLLDASDFLFNNCVSGLIFRGVSFEELSKREDLAPNDFLDIALMLKAMGIECLLKTILIKSGKIEITDDEMKLKKHGTHSLLDMAKDAGVITEVVNKIENEMLVVLSKYIILGRYPVLGNKLQYEELPYIFGYFGCGINGKLEKRKGVSWNNDYEQASKDIIDRANEELLMLYANKLIRSS